MTFKEIDPTTWKPEKEGDSIEGILVGKQENVGDNNSNMYNIDTGEKGIFGVWGSAVLDPKMIYVNVEDKIRITFKGLGIKQSGKFPPKLFKVEVDAVDKLNQKL